MTCPICGEKTIVKDSRSETDSIRRRRECCYCGYRFSTEETEIETKKKSQTNFDHIKTMNKSQMIDFLISISDYKNDRVTGYKFYNDWLDNIYEK